MKKEALRKKGMARLMELAFRKKGLAVGSCVLSVLSCAVSFAPYIAVYYIIRELLTHFSNLGALNTAYMMRLGWIAAGSAAASLVLYWLALMCSHTAAFGILYDLKLEFTRHIARLPLGFHTANSTGKLRKTLDENIEKLEGFVAHQLPDLAGSAAAPVASLVILFLFDWRMGLASLVPIIVAYLIQAAAFSNSSAQTFMTKYQNALEEMNNAAVEYVRGIPVVKAFNQTVFSFRKFYEMIADYGSFVKSYTANFKTCYSVFMLIINQAYLFVMPLIILLVGGSVPGGAEDYAAFAAAAVFYLIFSFSLATPFTKLVYVAGTGRQIADCIERVDAVLDTPPLAEAESPKTASEYSLSFENVSFSYGGENRTPALSGVSFTARQGELTALAGPSGGGKSTIAHLVPRFYDVLEGAVKIGGVNVRDMASDYLMTLVSFVFQDTFLFKQSVADNILIGRKDASREEVIAAAKAAQCHEFIEKLPAGYDTIIGVDNVHLSGGEKQRIVIARAVLKDAPIIVLDEATAFADPENEQKTHAAFEKLLKGKTVVMIAHRLSTVKGADKIIVIDKGQLAEEGRHEDLIKAGGLYSIMWEQYNAALDWTIAGADKKEEIGEKDV